MGLVVAGYSGRDESIMRTLEAALENSGAFPAGLFWLHRGDDAPYERVADLLRNASAKGIEAGLVRVQNFDEALRDLIRLIPDLNMNVLNEFGKRRARWSAAPPPTGKGGWPVIRLNALCFDQIPTFCRRIVCEVGGHADAKKAVQDADVDLLVARTQRGVLAFGSDEAARAAFSPYNITEFDLAQIEVRRLRYESADRGLLREAFGRAVTRQRMMNLVRRRSMDLLYPQDATAADFRELAKLVHTLSGQLDEFPELKWFEGVGVRLEWADEKLWVLLEPTMVFPTMSEDAKGAAADLGRERTFKRYNRPLNNLIDFWARFLFGDGTQLRALNITDGVDAVFQLIERTGFSRRAVA